MSAPNIVSIIQEQGSISDQVDYALMNYLLKNRGPGYTACQPSLVELEDGKQAIKMGIDLTHIDKNNQLMGLGIVGTIFIDFETLKVLFCTPLDELEANAQKLRDTGLEAQPRPKGKY